MSDNINNPRHYNQGSIECINAMLSAFGKKEVIAFCKLNAFKYLWRANYKGHKEEDLNKASWYINKAQELLSREENENYAD